MGNTSSSNICEQHRKLSEPDSLKEKARTKTYAKQLQPREKYQIGNQLNQAELKQK